MNAMFISKDRISKGVFDITILGKNYKIRGAFGFYENLLEGEL